LADVRGDREDVETGFNAAAGMLRELRTHFWLAVTLLEHVEWLAKNDAKAIFERLGAQP
jgi:hypothetical protein